jgi:hypothetical protein
MCVGLPSLAEELPSTRLPRGWVNRGKKGDRGVNTPACTMRLRDFAALRALPLLHLFEIVLAEAGVYVVGVPIHLDEEEGTVHTR